MQKLFKWFTLSQERVAMAQMDWFVKQFGIEEFDGIEKVFWCFLNFCSRLGVPAKKQYLEGFLRSDGKYIIKQYGIRLPTMENLKYNDPAMLEEARRIIASTAMATYDEWLKEDLTDRTFKVDVSTFMTERLTEQLQVCMAKAFPRLSNGDNPEEIMSDITYRMAVIGTTYSQKCLNKLDFVSGEGNTSYDKKKMTKLFTTGIPCIDGDIGGAYTKQLVSFTGSPGAGKTRFAIAHYVYRALVVAKIDVLMYELELSEMEIENMLIAHHIVHLYKGKIKIPDSEMNKGELSPEQRRYYEAARIDLFESGKYGRLHLITDDLVIENFEDEVYTHLRYNHNTKLMVIDYAGLAKSKPKDKYDKRYDDYEIIVELYKRSKEICKTADICTLILNQFNEKGNDAAFAGKRITPGMVQGGQIVSRHADYDIAMTMTEEQELANIRMFSTVKKRGAKGFKNVPVLLDAAVSLFKQAS